MDSENDKSEKDKWIEEGKRFRDSTLEYLNDNFLTILLILFIVAAVSGLIKGCFNP